MSQAAATTAFAAIKEHSPLLFLGTWLVGIPWNSIAAMLAAVWTAWMLLDKAVAKWKAWRAKRQQR